MDAVIALSLVVFVVAGTWFVPRWLLSPLFEQELSGGSFMEIGEAIILFFQISLFSVFCAATRGFGLFFAPTFVLPIIVGLIALYRGGITSVKKRAIILGIATPCAGVVPTLVPACLTFLGSTAEATGPIGDYFGPRKMAVVLVFLTFGILCGALSRRLATWAAYDE